MNRKLSSRRRFAGKVAIIGRESENDVPGSNYIRVRCAYFRTSVQDSRGEWTLSFSLVVGKQPKKIIILNSTPDGHRACYSIAQNNT